MHDLNSYLIAQRADSVAIYIPEFEFSDDTQAAAPVGVGLADVARSVAGVVIVLAVILGGAFMLIAP